MLKLTSLFLLLSIISPASAARTPPPPPLDDYESRDTLPPPNTLASAPPAGLWAPSSMFIPAAHGFGESDFSITNPYRAATTASTAYSTEVSTSYDVTIYTPGGTPGERNTPTRLSSRRLTISTSPVPAAPQPPSPSPTHEALDAQSVTTPAPTNETDELLLNDAGDPISIAQRLSFHTDKVAMLLIQMTLKTLMGPALTNKRHYKVSKTQRRWRKFTVTHRDRFTKDDVIKKLSSYTAYKGLCAPKLYESLSSEGLKETIASRIFDITNIIANVENLLEKPSITPKTLKLVKKIVGDIAWEMLDSQVSINDNTPIIESRVADALKASKYAQRLYEEERTTAYNFAADLLFHMMIQGLRYARSLEGARTSETSAV